MKQRGPTRVSHPSPIHHITEIGLGNFSKVLTKISKYRPNRDHFAHFQKVSITDRKFLKPSCQHWVLLGNYWTNPWPDATLVLVGGVFCFCFVLFFCYKVRKVSEVGNVATVVMYDNCRQISLHNLFAQVLWSCTNSIGQ